LTNVKIGFLINPIAGMGGRIGLGGTDGKSRKELEKLGAVEIAQQRAISALRGIKEQPCANELVFLTGRGEMGGDALTLMMMKCEIVHKAPAESGAEDTTEICSRFLIDGVELIVFVGGDGTARDIAGAVGKRVSILGIPSGVKMHSSVFANTPEDAGRVIQGFFDRRQTVEREVMDVDEESFRAGRVSARLFGIVIVPDSSENLQPRKSPTDASTEADEIEEIVEYFSQNIEPETLYLLGTGSTVGAISRKLGIKRNDLAVNAIAGGLQVGHDLAEKEILALIQKYGKARIVVTPIGGQGFVFGRGNQQLSAEVLRTVGNDDIIIVAGPTKLSKIKSLRVDTNDADINERLRGYWKVLTGYARYRAVLLQ
jgi:predicted polyphosphate/ATP-dependent NAD kinase